MPGGLLKRRSGGVCACAVSTAVAAAATVTAAATNCRREVVDSSVGVRGSVSVLMCVAPGIEGGHKKRVRRWGSVSPAKATVAIEAAQYAYRSDACLSRLCPCYGFVTYPSAASLAAAPPSRLAGSP